MRHASFFRNRIVSSCAITLSALLFLAGCSGPEENQGDSNSTSQQDMAGGSMTDMAGGGGDADMGGGGMTDPDLGGGTDPGDMGMDSGGETQMTPEEYEAAIHDRINRLLCRLLLECPQVFGNDLLDLNKITSEEQCLSSHFSDGDFEPELAGEREIYSLTEAQACLDEISQAEAKNGCELFDLFSAGKQSDSACERIIQGTVPEGEPCLGSSECEGERFCGYAPDNMECYGICQELPLPCEGACTDDQFCDEFSETCEPRVGKGETCDLDEMCVEGLECDYDTFTCEAPSSATQIPALDRLADGEPCSYDYDEFDEWCETGKTCINVDVETFAGVCGAPLVEGEACTISYECQLGLDCVRLDQESETGVCSAPKSNGEACVQTQQCGEGYCQDGTCVAYKGPGEVCESGECESFCNVDNVCQGDDDGGEVIECMIP